MKKELKEGIKIQAIKNDYITKDGLKHFSEPSRKSFKNRMVRRSMHSVFAYSDEISNEKKLVDFVFNNYSYGYFYIMSRCHAKNKWHNGPKTIAIINIKETEDGGYRYEFRHPISKKGRTINRLKRYWFWEDD